MPKEYSVLIVSFLGMLISVLDMDMDLFKEAVDDFKKIKVERTEALPGKFID